MYNQNITQVALSPKIPKARLDNLYIIVPREMWLTPTLQQEHKKRTFSGNVCQMCDTVSGTNAIFFTTVFWAFCTYF